MSPPSRRWLWGLAALLGLCPLAAAAGPAAAVPAAGGAPPLPQQVVVGDLGRSRELDAARLSLFRPDRGAIPGQPLRLHYPLSLAAVELDPYGWRYAQSRQAWRMHTGLDLVVGEGTPVLAALAGVVSLVEMVDGYGLTLILEHGRGWQTLYAHLADVAVRPGERLAAGSPVGRVGRSGQATTPHLHFELRRRQGDVVVALDPAPVLLPPPRLDQGEAGVWAGRGR
ncbi:MAG: M23 family metallopeptidase [Prochlorococcaceae cyanobacterium]